MKQLTIVEMETISGGYLPWGFDTLVSNVAEAAASIAMGASVGAMAGSIIGGRWGGAGGGLLGFGIIGQGVGMIWGLAVGGIGCGIAGGLAGWDMTLDYSKRLADGIIDGSFAPWTE